MKIATQLFREFVIPLLISIGWAIYITMTSNESSHFKVFVTAFGPTFFLVSWLMGQYFRVKKQVTTEKSFTQIEEKFNNLFNDIENKNKETISYITGGDSFIYFMIGQGMKSPIVRHIGKYPMYDISVVFTDLDCLKIEENQKILGRCETPISLGTFYPQSTNFIPSITLNSKTYNIFITARNGFFTQLFRSKEENGRYMTAIRLQDNINKTILFEQIDDHFGDVEW